MGPDADTHIVVAIADLRIEIYDLTGALAAEWHAPLRKGVRYHPYGWLLCGDELFHVTRRHRILRKPSDAPERTFAEWLFWGAEGAERLLVCRQSPDPVATVYNLASNGEVLYCRRAPTEKGVWTVCAEAGALVWQTRYARVFHTCCFPSCPSFVCVDAVCVCMCVRMCVLVCA